MVKPVITLEPEEVRILIEYLSHFEEDVRKYKDIEKVYEELHKKYQLAKGNYSDELTKD